MIKMTITTLASLMCSVALAQSPTVLNIVPTPLGLGRPGLESQYDTAVPIADGYFHVPQYMPHYPTAATIWPRVIDIPCKTVNGQLVCEGRAWTPDFGRAEYLFVRPRVVTVVPPAPAPAASACCCEPKTKTIEVEQKRIRG